MQLLGEPGESQCLESGYYAGNSVDKQTYFAGFAGLVPDCPVRLKIEYESRSNSSFPGTAGWF